jgi:hypothetical protein
MQKYTLMKLDCDYKDLKYLYWCLKEYRYKFLKRQNINQYRRQKKGTPKQISNLINAFDRKINNLPIFTDEIKKEYLKGINTIFANFYSMKDEYLSRKDYYSDFWAEQYCVFKNPKYIISFKEFKEQGYYKRYYKK